MIRSKTSRVLLTLFIIALFCAMPFFLGLRGHNGGKRESYYLGNPAIPQDDAPSVRYRDAVKCLKQGKSYEYAMAQLEEAVRRQPDNPEYHLALGCAYADRAASLGYAESFTDRIPDDQAKHSEIVTNWKNAQKDPKHPLFATSRPAPPPEYFSTKDDDKPLRLTEDRVVETIGQLGKLAMLEWQKGVLLSDTGGSHAKAKYTQGCGMLLLSLYEDVATYEGARFLPSGGEAAEVFSSAIRDTPDSPLYWECLGAATIAAGGQSKTVESAMQRAGVATKFPLPITSALNAYRYSLLIDPKNGPLCYELYRQEFSPPLLSQSGPDMLMAELKSAVKLDPGNACPAYQAAYLEFTRTHFVGNSLAVTIKGNTDGDLIDGAMARKVTDADKRRAARALNAIENANSAPKCNEPEYAPPIPDLLKPAWGYVEPYPSSTALTSAKHLRSLARDVFGYAKVSAMGHNLPEAVRALRDVTAMGDKLIGAWPIKDSAKGSNEVITTLNGLAVKSIGYEGLVIIYQAYGTPEQARQAAAEYADFKTRKTAYCATLPGHQQLYSLY